MAIPESTVVRQLLESALAQLPNDGVNIVLFGQVAGDREHLERALFLGAPLQLRKRNGGLSGFFALAGDNSS